MHIDLKKNQEKKDKYPWRMSRADMKTWFLLNNQLYGLNISMRLSMAMGMASSKFVVVTPKSNTNIKVEYNDKAEKNTVSRSVPKQTNLLNINWI